MGGSDLVTVVVPAADEERFIGRCLDSVCAQEHTELQILVVDGGSTDRTAEVVRQRAERDRRIELLSHARRNIPSSLNLALRHARGRWLVRVDAHSTIPPDYVALAVERLREGRWGGVGGRKDGDATSAAGRAIAVAMGSKLGVGNSLYHHGTREQQTDHVAFGAYPVALLKELGGWNERITANEDFELDYRIREHGHRLLFDPRMRIAWRCRESTAELFRQYRRYGAGKVDVALLHPRSISPRHVMPPAFVLYAALAAVRGVRRPEVALAMVAPYLLAVGLESVRCGSRLQGMHERSRLPLAFASMHLGWGIGFWLGLVQRLGVRRDAGQVGDASDRLGT